MEHKALSAFEQAELQELLVAKDARIAELEAGLRIVRQHHATAWNRGHRIGLAGSDMAIKQAGEARESYLDENQRLTDLLLATEDKLAAKDALIAKLRDALDQYAIGQIYNMDHSAAKQALSIQHDDTALRELIAKERKAADEETANLWAEIHTLRAAVQGPDGYATWQEAAVAERVLRVKAEADLVEARKEALLEAADWLDANYADWWQCKLAQTKLSQMAEEQGTKE